MLKRIFASRKAPTPRAIDNTFELYKRISAQYVNQDILDYVRRLIPEEIVKKTKIEDQEEPLKSVLQWFKRDFMRWIPRDPKCERCNLPMSSQFIRGISWNLRSTERYICNNCGVTIIFPRYGDILKIAETRTGRCSEWSMLFGALLNSLSIKTRIVHDYLDHCWNESLIDERWIHIDSTLAYPISFDHPYYYEQNWNKNYCYVLAFSYNGLEDVTQKYTQQWDIVQLRRKKSTKVEEEIADIYSRIDTSIAIHNNGELL
jgi:peptide-N4-(N-acetyl-beta-glucosaminyl)asparagine amidase